VNNIESEIIDTQKIPSGLEYFCTKGDIGEDEGCRLD